MVEEGGELHSVTWMVDEHADAWADAQGEQLSAFGGGACDAAGDVSDLAESTSESTAEGTFC